MLVLGYNSRTSEMVESNFRPPANPIKAKDTRTNDAKHHLLVEKFFALMRKFISELKKIKKILLTIYFDFLN